MPHHSAGARTGQTRAQRGESDLEHAEHQRSYAAASSRGHARLCEQNIRDRVRRQAAVDMRDFVMSMLDSMWDIHWSTTKAGSKRKCEPSEFGYETSARFMRACILVSWGVRAYICGFGRSVKLWD